jgi:hypothetical protein
MTRHGWLAFLLPLAACESLEETYNDITASLVAEGIVLGVEAPRDDRIDLSNTEYSEGTAITMFLADAESADALEEAPVEGAQVSVRGDQLGNVPMAEAGGGLYNILPDGTVVYVDNATWTIAATVGETQGTSAVTLPPPAALTIAEQHAQGQPIVLNFTGMGFTSVLVAVLDVQSGQTTFSNQPEDIKAVYDMTHGTTEVTQFEVPGTAFSGQSLYALGVAGMTHTDGADLDGFNSLLSAVMAGKMRIYPVSTVPTGG